MKKLLLVLSLVLCMTAQMILPTGAAYLQKNTKSFGSDIVLPPDDFGDDPLEKFTDLKVGAWYYSAVKYMVEKGYMAGTSDYNFSPDRQLTRAEFVRVLYMVKNGKPVSGSNPFTDVIKGKWYYDAVIWAYQNGITNGTTATTFAPNDKVTREQVAQFMYNAYGAGSDAPDKISSFPDGGKVSKWAKNAMNWAIGKSIISGKGVGGVTILDPQGNATRAELASIMYRMLHK